MGTFMDKETLEAEAERLGVTLDGLSWPQKQKAVLNAKVDAGEEIQYGATIEKKKAKIIAYRDISAESDRKLKQIYGKRLLISPEIQPRQYQLFKYDEELGDELLVEDKSFDLRQYANIGKDMVTGTVKIVGKNKTKTIAQSTLPKQNAGIIFRPGIDLVPVVIANNRQGYLFNHHRFPHIKDLLIKSGYWHEYKNQFQDEPNVWYAAGKQLVCDINFTHAVFAEIERKEKEKRALRDK